jgi:hypothetical protein
VRWDDIDLPKRTIILRRLNNPARLSQNNKSVSSWRGTVDPLAMLEVMLHARLRRSLFAHAGFL